MKDQYGFSVEKNDFVVFPQLLHGRMIFMEGRVKHSFENALEVDVIRIGNGHFDQTTIYHPFMKITAPSVEERLKEKFWEAEKN